MRRHRAESGNRLETSARLSTSGGARSRAPPSSQLAPPTSDAIPCSRAVAGRSPHWRTTCWHSPGWRLCWVRLCWRLCWRLASRTSADAPTGKGRRGYTPSDVVGRWGAGGNASPRSPRSPGCCRAPTVVSAAVHDRAPSHGAPPTAIHALGMGTRQASVMAVVTGHAMPRVVSPLPNASADGGTGAGTSGGGGCSGVHKREKGGASCKIACSVGSGAHAAAGPQAEGLLRSPSAAAAPCVTGPVRRRTLWVRSWAGGAHRPSALLPAMAIACPPTAVAVAAIGRTDPSRSAAPAPDACASPCEACEGKGVAALDATAGLPGSPASPPPPCPPP